LEMSQIRAAILSGENADECRTTRPGRVGRQLWTSELRPLWGGARAEPACRQAGSRYPLTKQRQTKRSVVAYI
jgi:hypothetical protein